MDKSLELISDYTVSLSYDDLPASAVRAVKHKFIDSMGCALGAYLWEPCKIARRLCFPTESPLTARVIGSLVRTTPEMAAFANSTMVRTLDFNDSYRVKGVAHVSDTIPAVLAMGEAVHANGKDLVTGIALAYEMGVCFVEKMLTKKEWEPCALAATFGSALGAGKILGLTKEQLGNAASLALVPNMNLAMRASFGKGAVGELSMYKEVYAGMSARQGVFAALMAGEGMTGPGEAIEGKFGLKVVTDTIQFEPFGGNGRQFAVERVPLKSFPVRDAIQLPMRTALDLREKVSPDEIKSVTVTTYASAYASSAADPELWTPKTRETADHSMAFCVAAALIDGDITPETFSRERFRDSDVVDLISRMRIDEDPEFSKQSPAKRNCRIEVKTHSGDTRVVHRVFTAEELEKGWTDEQVEAKFLRLVHDILTPTQARASLALMWHLEDVDDVARILDNFQV